MIIDKKYLDKQYIGRLCIGAVRFDLTQDENDMTLVHLAKLMSYIIDDHVNIIETLTNVYETEHPVYLKVLGNLIKFKVLEPNISNSAIRQKLINIFEKKVDNNTFTQVFQFIDATFSHIDSKAVANVDLDVEFNKMLKFILLNNNLKNINTLYNEFYEHDDSTEQYTSVVANVFKSYENSIVSKDITLDNTPDSIMKALGAAAKMGEEVRAIELFEHLRFVEKKRVAIAVGVSGTGKSMFLCHCTAEYLQRPKYNKKKNLLFYFTFENSQEETYIRIMANVLEIAIDDIKVLIKDEDEKRRLAEAFAAKIDVDTVLKIIELPPKKHSMATVEAEIKKELQRHPDAEVYAVALDYVDKMLPCDMSNKTKRYDQQLGDVVDDFKSLTRTFECAGLSVSQVNRIGAKKSKGQEDWNMTDIGGSWEKVENADIILLIDVENMYEEQGFNLVRFRNEKHRYAKDGSVITSIMKPQFAKFMEAPDNMTMEQMNKDRKGGKKGSPNDTTSGDPTKLF